MSENNTSGDQRTPNVHHGSVVFRHIVKQGFLHIVQPAWQQDASNPLWSGAGSKLTRFTIKHTSQL